MGRLLAILIVGAVLACGVWLAVVLLVPGSGRAGGGAGGGGGGGGAIKVQAATLRRGTAAGTAAGGEPTVLTRWVRWGVNPIAVGPGSKARARDRSLTLVLVGPPEAGSAPGGAAAGVGSGGASSLGVALSFDEATRLRDVLDGARRGARTFRYRSDGVGLWAAWSTGAVAANAEDPFTLDGASLELAPESDQVSSSSSLAVLRRKIKESVWGVRVTGREGGRSGSPVVVETLMLRAVAAELAQALDNALAKIELEVAAASKPEGPEALLLRVVRRMEGSAADRPAPPWTARTTIRLDPGPAGRSGGARVGRIELPATLAVGVERWEPRAQVELTGFVPPERPERRAPSERWTLMRTDLGWSAERRGEGAPGGQGAGGAGVDGTLPTDTLAQTLFTLDDHAGPLGYLALHEVGLGEGLPGHLALLRDARLEAPTGEHDPATHRVISGTMPGPYGRRFPVKLVVRVADARLVRAEMRGSIVNLAAGGELVPGSVVSITLDETPATPPQAPN
jgi:hypothetical protein